jgi:epoxyqueuosine reductase
MSPDPRQLSARLRALARRLGFDLVGIASADPSIYRDYFRHWLDTGQAGSMTWLARRFDERADPGAYLPGAASVICVALNYHVPLQPPSDADRPHHGRIARYALGHDYHVLIRKRLHALADFLRDQAPHVRTRIAVDTAPVMEKELAARAGIGWMGKNTCIINPDIGSWLLLGQIITTLALPPDQQAQDHCGTCTCCIDACPTGAITAPYQLDASLCISYLTIEHRAPIPDEHHQHIGQWLFGCDICQEVCPWNRRAPSASDPALQPRFPTGTVDVRRLLTWSEDAYRATLRASAMKRLKLPLLRRNAAIVQKNLAAP